MLNKTIFDESMEMLCEIYQREPSKLLLKVYYLVLQNMSDQEFEKSVKIVLETRKYSTFPLPAEILQAIPPKRYNEE